MMIVCGILVYVLLGILIAVSVARIFKWGPLEIEYFSGLVCITWPIAVPVCAIFLFLECLGKIVRRYK